jgi:hypothetical protein
MTTSPAEPSESTLAAEDEPAECRRAFWCRRARDEWRDMEADLAAALAKLAAVEALAGEWLDSTADGECPDGFCGGCTLGLAGQRLTAALTTRPAP